MRVSTNTLYGAVARAIAQRQAEMEKTGQRITSGQRIITPSDDPLGAARLVAAAEQRLGLRLGQTDSDGNWSLEEISCIGACALGPLLLIDGQLQRDGLPLNDGMPPVLWEAV